MILTTKSSQRQEEQAGKRMVRLRDYIFLVSERLALCSHQVTFPVAQSQPSPEQSTLSSVRRGFKYLTLAAQKQTQGAAISVLTFSLAFLTGHYSRNHAILALC